MPRGPVGIGPPIADIFQPDLRVLVDLGYGDFGPGLNYANVPTPAGLFEIPQPIHGHSGSRWGPSRARTAPWSRSAWKPDFVAVVFPQHLPVDAVDRSSPELLPRPAQHDPAIAAERVTGDVLHVIPPVANILLPI